MGKSFILVNVTFFFSLFASFSGLLNDCSSSSAHLTTNDIRDVDQHGGLQAFQVWIIYKSVKIRDLPSFSLIWHLYLYFCCYRQLSPPTSSPGRFSLASMEKRPGDEVALASFDCNECWGTEVRDQTEIAWYCPQFSMGNSFPNMSVTELWRASSAFSFWFGFLRCVEYRSSAVPG